MTQTRVERKVYDYDDGDGGGDDGRGGRPNAELKKQNATKRSSISVKEMCY